MGTTEVLHVRHSWSGRLPPRCSSRIGVSGSSIHPRQAGPCLARSHLWTEELKKTQALWSSVQKGTQSKGNRPGAESKGHQGSEVTAFAGDIPGRECSILGGGCLG